MSGGRRREGGGGDWGGQTEEEDRLSQEEKQVEGMWSMLEPGARECLVTLTTAGENMPDRTEEHGETARLTETGEEASLVDHHLSLSQSSERMDSREDAGVGNKSMESVGLVLSSDADALFTRKPEPHSEALGERL